MPDPVHLVRDAFPDEPGLDTAVSRALLLRASAGEVPETFRIHVPGRIVAFGKRDTLETGYRRAVAATRRGGFAPIERLAGGRAAVFTEHTLAFAWTIPDPDPRRGIYERFDRLASLMVRAFTRLEVTAEIGEIPGEYCPGQYSVHHTISEDRRIKLMGVGQRLARRAAHIGGVVVVDHPELVRDILVPVYSALGLGWLPETAGALTDVQPGVSVADSAAAIIADLGSEVDLVSGSLDDATLDLARTLAPEHAPAA